MKVFANEYDIFQDPKLIVWLIRNEIRKYGRLKSNHLRFLIRNLNESTFRRVLAQLNLKEVFEILKK